MVSLRSISLLALAIACVAAAPASARPILGLNDTAGTFATHPGATERTGAAVARIPVSWAESEPQPGEYDWARYDRAVSALERRDVGVLFVLFAAPPWASEGCEVVWPLTCGVGEGYEDEYLDFALRLLDRYPRAKVQSWNEPDLPHFGSVLPPRMAELTNALFAAAPGRVIGPAASPGSKGFLYYTSAAYGLIDPRVPMALHLYPRSPMRAQGYRPDWRAARAIAGERPIWVTEIGYASSSFGRRGQARALARTYRFLADHGARVIIVHRLKDARVDGHRWLSSMGLLRRDGTRKPAYRALRLAARR